MNWGIANSIKRLLVFTFIQARVESDQGVKARCHVHACALINIILVLRQVL